MAITLGPLTLILSPVVGEGEGDEIDEMDNVPLLLRSLINSTLRQILLPL